MYQEYYGTGEGEEYEEENYKKYQKGEFSLDNQLRNNILEFFKLSNPDNLFDRSLLIF